ncbi:hypothetical protein RUND412_001740 [Rhizina undulata]
MRRHLRLPAILARLLRKYAGVHIALDSDGSLKIFIPIILWLVLIGLLVFFFNIVVNFCFKPILERIGRRRHVALDSDIFCQAFGLDALCE